MFGFNKVSVDVPERFIFRQVYAPDIRIFAEQGELRAKNHAEPQACHQTSYVDLVERRGTEEFTMPCGGVVNDYVPFYFSPITAFCYTIHRGNVQLRSPNGDVLGIASQNDRAFIVYRALDLLNNDNLTTYFSNTSLNNKSIDIVFGQNVRDIDSVVSWNLFDDSPIVARIPEVGYDGCCQYFMNRATPERYQDRSQRRMAEFLVRDAVPLSMACCIVVPCEDSKNTTEQILSDTNLNIPVFVKPGCFF